MIVFADIVFSSRSWWLPALALLLVAAAFVWAGHRSGTQRRVRFACGLLKFAAILTLAVCLLEPAWVGDRARPGANVIALMADNSQSLQVKDPGRALPRGEMLRDRLSGSARHWQSALEATFQVRRYWFDTRLQDTRAFDDLDFEGRASGLGAALQTASQRWRGEPVAGIILFTDGIATDLAAGSLALDGCPPVYPVMLGDESGLQDLSLDKVAASQTAFEDAPVTLQAEVSAHGLGGVGVDTRVTEVGVGTVPVQTGHTQALFQFTRASQVVAEQARRPIGQDASLNLRFQLQPTGPGIHFYEVATRLHGEDTAASAQTREATFANNRRLVVVDRGQEVFRVLYVGGRPNWEYKFLNRAILDDPQVKMVSLVRVALREPKFEFKGRPGEATNPMFRGFGQQDEETSRYDQPVVVRMNTADQFELRGGFPKTAEELFQYHAVILDRVEAGFFSPSQLALLHRFVSERGGAFLMLGGAESFREGNYADTPVAALLPVYLGPVSGVKRSGPFKWNLTRDGWLQPWTRLRATEAEEQARLEAMPAFEVLNPLREAKPGAIVLATVSDSDQHRHPALVIQRFGLGRSAALAVGDFWRWGLRDEAMQKDLAKFWRQLIRGLMADVPSRVSVAVEPVAAGHPGEVRLVVRARDEEFKPLDNAAVRLEVRPIRLATNATGPGVVTAPAPLLLQPDQPAGQPGAYEAAFIPRDAAAYAVSASVSLPTGKPVGQAAAGWVYDPAAEEFRSLRPNRALLEDLARATGGRMVELSQLERLVRDLPRLRAPITETAIQPLWPHPAVFLFALVCLVSEWGIRRWKGLP